MTVPFLDIQAMHSEVRGGLDAAWHEVTRTGSFVGGPLVDRFEEEWARYCSARFAVGVANGTDALGLTLEALGIGPGDEVIVPANTFIATAAAVSRVGATPVFVDVSPDTLLVTADHVRAAITPRTAAVMVVHLYGQPADLTEIGAVAGSAGIAVIEDAAQAHGARWQGQRVGAIGNAGCFSFYPGKNLGALGDGGAVVTNDEDLARDAFARWGTTGGGPRNTCMKQPEQTAAWTRSRPRSCRRSWAVSTPGTTVGGGRLRAIELVSRTSRSASSPSIPAPSRSTTCMSCAPRIATNCWRL